MKEIERVFWDVIRPMKESYLNDDADWKRIEDLANNFFDYLVDKSKYKGISVDDGADDGVVFRFELVEPYEVEGDDVTHDCLLMEQGNLVRYIHHIGYSDYWRVVEDGNDDDIVYNSLEEACRSMLGTTDFETNLQKTIINTLH